MDSKDYGVRVVCAFQQFRVGQVIFPNGAHRQMLVKNGFVERIAHDDAEDEAPKSNNAIRQRPRLKLP